MNQYLPCFVAKYLTIYRRYKEVNGVSSMKSLVYDTSELFGYDNTL